ncbi:hypothetical protein LCGC14_1026860 [marine sediment metagenome]|uniref:Uncharacterized protein n=1 Tax=marine sediment metagenome TaxID=412755 RepID=A0A0F9N0D8_9ZZZZ
MNLVEFVAIHFVMIVAGLILGIRVFFIEDPELQSYFWFPLLFSLVALVSGLIEIKLRYLNDIGSDAI